jgi:hypothetical protein
MTRGTAIAGTALWLMVLAVPDLEAREYHVVVSGDDGHDGSREQPLRTISAAAARAEPGDVVAVHGCLPGASDPAPGRNLRP